MKIYKNEEKNQEQLLDFPFASPQESTIIAPKKLGQLFDVHPVKINNILPDSDLAIQNWNFSGVFSATDSDTVQWSAGTLVVVSGDSFSITASNTGNMTNTTYIYFDKSTSTTAFQTTTTYSTANGANKILIATAYPSVSLFTDNFNSYATDHLGGQGSWVLHASSPSSDSGYEVQAADVYEGAKAIRTSDTTSGGLNHKAGTALASGQITIFAKVVGSSTLASAYIWMGEVAGSPVSSVGRNIWIGINGDVDNKITYAQSNGTSITNIVTTIYNTWFPIQLRWQPGQFQYNVNNAGWSTWLTANITFDTIGFISLYHSSGAPLATNYVEFDTIQQNISSSGFATFQVFGGTGGIGINTNNLSVNQLSDLSLALGGVTSGTLSGITSLALRDTSAAFDVTITPTSSAVLSAARTLTLDVSNANRTVDLSGNLTLAADLITSGANSLTLTTTGATNVTVPTSGTLYGTASASITSAQLLASLSDETGTGLSVFNNTPSLTTPAFTGNPTGTITSGTYSPGVTSETNLDATTTASEAQYLRVGNTVTVSGRFNANPTLTATATNFEISLPIASNIGAVEDVAGVAFCGSIVSQGAAINGVVANDTAQIEWIATDVTAQDWSYTFTYQII